MEIVISVLSQGMIYAIMAFGIYITYKILDFPDLTADGSFPLGAALSAILITNGVNPYLTLPLSFLAGALAGMLTGLIHVKCKVRDLLSGIIMMTALYTINLRVAGKSNVPLFSGDTMFSNNMIDTIFPESVKSSIKTMLVCFILVLICKIILDLYMSTKSGFLLKAVGDNPTLVTSLAKDKGTVKILGLAIANGLIALSGSAMAQYQRYFDISMGTGTMVIGLASVIMGINLCKSLSFMKHTTAVILGAIIYRGAWALVMKLGLDAKDMKLVTAVLLLIFLVISRERKKKVKIHA